MLGSVFVAAETNGALRSGRIFVATVAEVARLVLWLCVQARKLCELMAARAGRHARRTHRAVGTVAGQTTGAELAMSALLLGAVAVGASLPHRETLVRLMTIGAELVPLRRRLLLSAMAAGAGRCLRSRMRFVAARATGVTGFDQACFALMAGVASHFVRLRVMR